jgi:hypothetical protein
MNIERETQNQPQSADINFTLPDGLSCHWQFHTSSTPTQVLLESVRALAEETANLGQESRLSGEKNSIQEVSEAIQAEFPELSVNSGKTTFFEQSLTDTSGLLIPNWDDILDKYTVVQLLKTTRQETTVIKSFMKDSFHNTNETRIDVSLRNPQNKIFLVIIADLYVGMFVLLEVPVLYEIQLHSVAGRGSLPSVSQEKGKLPILLSAMIHVINEDFNFVDKSTSSFAPPYQRITFSSSGAAPLYRNIGFVESDRGGVSMKKKTV